MKKNNKKTVPNVNAINAMSGMFTAPLVDLFFDMTESIDTLRTLQKLAHAGYCRNNACLIFSRLCGIMTVLIDRLNPRHERSSMSKSVTGNIQKNKPNQGFGTTHTSILKRTAGVSRNISVAVFPQKRKPCGS